MSRESIMITKLKEGLQEALVFLRQLGDFRIPAVMERRRKGLLDKLVDLQGDTFKGGEAPVKEKEVFSSPEPVVPRREEEEKKESPSRDSVTSPSRDSVTSPSKRLSRGDSKINALVGNYEHITELAKKEEVAETPKRFVQLKKVAKPSDFPDADKDKAKEEEEVEAAAPKEVEKVAEERSLTPQPSPQLRRKKENGTLNVERPSSTVSEESTNVEAMDEQEEEVDDGGEKESGKSKKKKGRFNISRLGEKLKKKKGRDKSPSRAAEEEEEKSGGSEVEEADKEDTGTPPEIEEGVTMSGVLERKVTARFKSKWVKVDVKLKDNVLIIGEKEQLELGGYLVSATDIGFDIVQHATQKQMHFKTEGGEDVKEKWVEAIEAAIKESSPEQEEPSEEPQNADTAVKAEDVPSITVEEPASEETLSSTLKRKRDSKTPSLTVTKPARKLPDQGVEMKGYIHRKKPGLGAKWDKTYCVLTYQAVYFSTMQDNTEYSHMLSLTGDNQQASISEKKGHDRSSKGIQLKCGKKKEELSFPSSEFDSWKSALERVLGIGGVEELLSEDEEIEEDVAEELYEELEVEEFPPPIPSSPRPAHSPLHVQTEPDDIIIDEDIYEDTDDYRQDIVESPVHQAPPPALPNRNPPKIDTTPAIPAPSLPPRNPLPPKSSGPALPPRGAKEAPQQYETSRPLAKKPPAKVPAKPPPPDVGGEEIYDDIVPAEDGQDAEMEETYDDVVVGGEVDEMEETYDDVVSATKPAVPQPEEPITEEYYEDMVPGVVNEPQEDYVVMEPGEDIGGEELYVDVDTPVPAHAIVQPKPVEQVANSPRTGKSGTFSRMFKNKPASPQPPRKGQSGTLHHKAPKKSKFEERWAVIDGNYLIIYKNQSAKSHTDKLPLSECGLDLGSPDVGPGEHAFRISTKGDKIHHFKVKTLPEFDRWVGVVKGLTKYAPVDALERSDAQQQIFQALEDHIGESEGELTFKKGTYIRLISKDANEYVGQIGNESQVFEGKIGKFPMSKVTVAEDLYI